MSRCKKGSRQWKKYNQAGVAFVKRAKTNSKQLEHKTTKEVVLFLEEEKVTHFVIGNVSGIEKNTKKDEKKKRKEQQSKKTTIISLESRENQTKVNL